VDVQTGGMLNTAPAPLTLSPSEWPAPVGESHRSHPFFCSVDNCQRRYRSTSGLRYHYQMSGSHGISCLALLEQGLHPSLQIAGPIAQKPRKPRQAKPTFKVLPSSSQHYPYPLLNAEPFQWLYGQAPIGPHPNMQQTQSHGL
jgi:hypothetical protein